MSKKLSKLRVVRVNSSVIFVTENGMTFTEIRRQFERYEQMPADTVQPVALTDKFTGKRTFAEVLENKEFTADDLPFRLENYG
ncbi:MAG TPA: hypothetical protein VF692_01750 [Pyrinomonadaceae bacterium]|jgi:hypothetical protein